MTQKSRVLALVGMPGAGKTLCAKHLEAKQFYQFRFGGIVVDEVARRGWPITPDNERRVREELRAQEGMEVMAKRALPQLQQALAQRPCIVIDGLYSFSEYVYLKTHLDAELIVVAIVSPRHLRYQRLSNRPERPLTSAEAEQRDIQEIVTLEKGGPIAIADYTLTNDGEPQDLLARLDALLDQLDFRP